ATFVLRIAATLARATDPAAADAWAAAFRAGCKAIQDIGGARAGDRTMLDALLPAAEAIEIAVAEGRDLAGLLSSAVHAAETGAAATATMEPKRGRSSYIGRRALGHRDPGAEAVAVCLRAIEAAVR